MTLRWITDECKSSSQAHQTSTLLILFIASMSNSIDSSRDSFSVDAFAFSGIIFVTTSFFYKSREQSRFIYWRHFLN